ncbi:MAG: hypothetical protein FD169_2380 [Bacillota bacterium]|nr:MAG: hypothetical protein FD169_2380 [Bacillota bacterium]MBS3950484.1 Rrf2 family transcriptional regulator [Peptococcaceae bacterium]
MKISAKGRYGLQAMLDLTLESTELVTLSSIAQRQNISPNYLEQIFSALRKAGLVKSVKGAQGGYTLAHTADRITAGQILRVLEGDLCQIGETVQAMYSDASTQLFLQQEVFEKLQVCVNELLDGLSLESLASEFSKQQQNLNLMYFI